jgi:chloride channel protein, CIC family
MGGIVAGLSLYALRRVTGGSGAEVTGAIWHKQGQFEAAPTIVKSLISIVIVGMGAAIGREASLKDTGASVAAKISDWTSLTPEQRHLLVACGAGAGMAAAYNVPLGGALFAVEVLLGTMSLTNVLAAVITSFVAVAVSWLLLPNAPTFNVAQLSITPSLLVWSAVAGPILGAASAVYVRFIGWSETGKPKAFMVIVAPILAFILLGFISIRFPEVLGEWQECRTGSFRQSTRCRITVLVTRPETACYCDVPEVGSTRWLVHPDHDFRSVARRTSWRGVELRSTGNLKG